MKMRASLRRLYRSVLQKTASLLRMIKHDIAAVTPRRAAEDVLLFLIALQLAVLGGNWLRNEQPILGLRLEGNLVGKLDGDFRHQADAIIHNRENKPILVKVSDTSATSTITLRQLGVSVDKNQVYDSLLTPGHTGNIGGRLADQDLAALGRRDISLSNPHFNKDLAKAYIATLDQQIVTSPANAYFEFKNQDVIVHPDTKGRTIETDAAIAQLQDIDPAHQTRITLPIRQVSAVVTSALLDPLLPQVQAITRAPLTIVAGESRTTLSREQLVALIVPKVTPDPKNAKALTAQLTFDETKLNAVVDETLKRVVVAAQPTIMSGNAVVKQGKSGVQAADAHSVAHILTALIQRQTGAAAPAEAHIPLVTVNPPVVQQVVNAPRTRTGTGRVQLTFDDGPGAHTERVLDILRRYNVRATFYVIGRNVQSYPGTMQRIKNEGHAIGNHSFSHADLSRLSRAGVVRELSSTQAAIEAACGVTPTAFRPPYGAQNATVREVAASMGMSVDLWSADTRDWAQPGSGAIARRAIDGAGPGAVILLHVLYQQTVDALPSIIEGIRSRGYTL